MKNAHLRLGSLEFIRVTGDTSLRVRVHLNMLIAERDCSDRSDGVAHLISVFGGDQDVGAIAAAITEGAVFSVEGPELPRLKVSLGESPEVFRGSIAIPGRKRGVRHLVAISRELARTRAGGDVNAKRTLLSSADPAFVLQRIGDRFGLPVLPDWSSWFSDELARKRAVQPLIGFGCEAVLVTGTKKRFLGWLGSALKRGRIHIPEQS
jgi:hypothetical protein